MCQFINLSIKAVSEKITEISAALFGRNHQRKNEISNQTKSYCGFTTEDWEKIGTDIKRSISNFQ